MRRKPKDLKVIVAFIDGHALDGNKLWTNGQRLDGHWLGGRGIAEKDDDGLIHFNDLGSRAAQSVQRLVKRYAPFRRLAERK